MWIASAAGFDDILDHHWVDGINFKLLEGRQYRPERVPVVDNEFDFSNLQDYGEDEELPSSWKVNSRPPAGSDAMFEML